MNSQEPEENVKRDLETLLPEYFPNINSVSIETQKNG